MTDLFAGFDNSRFSFVQFRLEIRHDFGRLARHIGPAGIVLCHGFRGMASTLLHELGYPHEHIERQLAHAERNKVSAAYNHAEYLPERRNMMQPWADYLDRLKAGAEVIPLTAKR